MKHYFVYFLFFYLSTALFGQNINNSIIGNVTDKSNGEPLPNCNIYLSGTQWGTTSNLEGDFNVRHIIPSQYEIVFSMIGYERESKIVNIKDNSTLELNIVLVPKEYDLEEVIVVSEIPDDWQDDLEIFKKYFLGITKFSDDCKIENEIQINFSHLKPHILKAYSNQPLIIKNMGLGFLINCELRKFEYDEVGNKVQYLIYTHFTEMDTSDEDVIDDWKENRYDAYLGSKDHFLYSLKENIFNTEGFEVSTSPIPYRRGQNYLRKTIFDSDLLLNSNNFEGASSFKFDNYLQVRYVNSGKMRKPISWLKILGFDVTLDRYGVPIEIMPFETYGSWAFSGISNMLPKFYYVLNKEVLER